MIIKNKSLFIQFILYFSILYFSQLASMAVYNYFVPFNNVVISMPTLLSCLISIVCMPCLEEWLFREQLLFNLMKKNSKWSSILISSLCFSAIHFQVYFIPFFLGGIIYSLARITTNRLWFSILLHSSYNGLALFLLYLEVR